MVWYRTQPSSYKEHCIQEHWLYQFEWHKLDDILPGRKYHARSVYEYNQISNAHMSLTGYGGVATLWLPDMDPYAEQTEEGNKRILLTTFTIPDHPICIINCYLPSGTSSEAIAKFEEDLDIIYELTVKYSKSHEVLILGDPNKDHHNRDKAKERLMKNLIRDLALEDLGSDNSSKHTYINQNLQQASHIDHILLKRRNGSCWSPKTILNPDCPENASNISPHLPVTVTLKVSRKILSRMKRKTQVTQTVQYQWKEANKGKFSETMVKELEQYKMELLSPEDGVQVFMHAIETATMDAVPAVTRKIGRKKGNPKWSSELSAAVKHPKKCTTYESKQEGRKGTIPHGSPGKKQTEK